MNPRGILLLAQALSLPILASTLPSLVPASQASSSSQSTTAFVNATDYKFSPQVLNITTGTTINWVNRGHAAHTSTENSTPPLWNSGNLNPGQNYSFRFLEPGVYSYYCAYHQGAPYFMSGEVNVTGPPIKVNTNGGETVPPILPYLVPLGVVGLGVVLVLFYLRRLRTVGKIASKKG